MAAILLVVVGPVMAFQEYQAASAARVAEELPDAVPIVDASFRAAWRLPVTILVFVVGVVGTLASIRVLADKAVRAVSGRLLAFLLGGLALVDVAYALDGTILLQADFAARALVVVWIYPLAGILVIGSIHRLADVEDHFSNEGLRSVV